jgi:Ubiquitin carboxyl-terminal hydrolase
MVFIISLLPVVVAVEAVRSSSSSASSSVMVSTGLQNLGNTCYMNAQLQCAYHIPRVRNIILSLPVHQSISQTSGLLHKNSNNKNNNNNDDDPSFSLENEEQHPETRAPAAMPESNVAWEAMRLVFADMTRNLLQQQPQQPQQGERRGPVSSPRILCQSLRIPVMEQQDAQEFWKLLLSAMRLPALTDLYQGAFEDYIVALDGSHRERRREEHFLDLSLDVSSGSLWSSLKQLFGEPELLSVEQGNGWRPGNKGTDNDDEDKKVDAHKGSLLRVQGLPSILQLHLKRFQYDWNTDLTTKLNHPFSFPLELDLSTICQDVSKDEQVHAIYDLQAVVVHMGEYGSGHYYAYVRPDLHKDVWYRFNDEIVTNELTFDDVYADSYGGHTSSAPMLQKGLLTRIRRAFQGDSYGYGGRTSNAYVVQYIRRSDIPVLYEEDSECVR